jgi:lipid-binding SYLF domain-containing protein
MVSFGFKKFFGRYSCYMMIECSQHQTKNSLFTSFVTSSVVTANHVLENFFNPHIKCDIPKKLFTASVGVVLISVVEVGFLISGSVGTGIFMKRNTTTGKWSYPVACGLGGLGWGFLVGGSVKDLIVFIFDPDTLHSLAYDKMGFKVGGQLEATIGTTGRSTNMDFTVSEQGFGNTISYAFSKGAFLGMSVEGAVIGARHKVNQTFYNRTSITPDEIFLGGFDLPANVDTQLQDVYTKLELLNAGATATAPVLNTAVHEVDESDEPDIDFVDAPPPMSK